MSSAPRRATVAFIFVTLVLDVLAFGVIIPVLPRLVEDFVGGDTAHAARMFGLFGTTWAFMQFFFSPVLGAVSDRFGRRPVILLSNFGLGLDFLFMAFAPTLGWLFVGRLISGITGASFSTASAYIADVTPPEKRAQSYGLVGAAWGLGFVLGPAAGGLLGAEDPRLPFLVAAGLTLVNACYGLFVLPESLPPERRAGFSWRRANPLGALALLRQYPGLPSLAAVNFLYWLGHQVLPSVFVLYAGYRYGWGAREVGLTLAFVGICGVVVQGGLVRPIVRRFGERRALLAGLLFGIAGYTLYGLAPTGTAFLFAVPVFGPMGLIGPAFQSLATRRVAPTEQGRLQGANSSTMGLTGMVGPALFTQVFARAVEPHAGPSLPGAPFLLAAFLLVLGFAIAWRVAVMPAAVTVPDAPPAPAA